MPPAIAVSPPTSKLSVVSRGLLRNDDCMTDAANRMPLHPAARLTIVDVTALHNTESARGGWFPGTGAEPVIAELTWLCAAAHIGT